MIKVAVCDDNKIDLELICYLVDEYIKCRPDVEFSVTPFSTAFDLLGHIDTPSYKDKFDIYLLDVIMPVIKGIEVGNLIREHDENCHIIFITASPEYALDSYDVLASGYIVKPVVKEKLFQTLDRVVSRLIADKDSSKSIPVKTKDGIQQIMLHMIRYAEYADHVIDFHLFNDTIVSTVTSSITMSGLADLLLKDSRFIMPHRAFIVNLKYVTTLKGQNFVMDNSEEIPVARAAFKKSKQRYLEFSQ